MNVQLTLPVFLQQTFSFDNFVVGSNAKIIETLTAFLKTKTEKFAYLCGPSGSGRSHLLYAACQKFFEAGLKPICFALGEIKNLSPELIENIETYDLVCLDDLQTIAGDAAWEEAVFHLYNKCMQAGSCLLISANSPPKDLPLQLADLSSRLLSGLILQIQELDDKEKLDLLQQAAKARGLDLSSSVGNFMLKNVKRDLGSLLKSLEVIDQASLSEKRKLTIPFVKKVLSLES